MITRVLIALSLLCTLAAPASAGMAEAYAAYDTADYDTALREVQPLAEAGNPDAEYSLGVMYYLGQGVTQDLVQAHRWLALAADQGKALAAEMRDVAAAGMTPEQLAEAEKLASQ